MTTQNRHSGFQLALSEAEACDILLRPGDYDSDHKIGGEGVRIMISDFGPHLPFILAAGTKDWLKRTYKMSDEQTSIVYRVLVAKAKRQIRAYQNDPRNGHKTTSMKDRVMSW